jgi:tRNA-specific 2-thiouridylase
LSGGQRVAVAMSGGVDSSVAAALLVEQGVECFGLMLRLWSGGPGGSNRCCSPADMAAARSIAAQLDIPFYVIDARQLFKNQVVDFFIDGYAAGGTPNPCIECNRHIRWTFLYERALAMGATHLATGHYARVRHDAGGRFALLRARDQGKDQSYVLSVLDQERLAHAMFPLGDLTKTEVRQHARRLGLPVAERVESQDLCFAGGADYRDFLGRIGALLPPPGPIVDMQGTVRGEHPGLAGFTIGQRKGLGISSSEALYVIDKDVERNRLIVGPRQALGRSVFEIVQVNWIDGIPPAAPLQAQVRVRYKAREVAAAIIPASAGCARVELAQPLPDVTPGQSAVFYRQDRCLGGGIIQP